jgi:hypothetical protein
MVGKEGGRYHLDSGAVGHPAKHELRVLNSATNVLRISSHLCRIDVTVHIGASVDLLKRSI